MNGQTITQTLDQLVVQTSLSNLNQILADTSSLRDLYMKHLWQVSGPNGYLLHVHFEKHYQDQGRMVDTLAARIHDLGGIALTLAPDVAEVTRIPRAPRGREVAPIQLQRLRDAHELIIAESRDAANEALRGGDIGTNEVLVADVVELNESQVVSIARLMGGHAPFRTASVG